MTSQENRVLEAGVREVSGTELPFATCIQDNTVPKPPIQDWKDWQIWRKGVGKRPKLSLGDAQPTTPRQESELWKATMQRLYGDEWRALLEEQQAAAPEVEEEEEAVSVMDGGSVSASASVVGTSALSSSAVDAPAGGGRRKYTLYTLFTRVSSKAAG